MKFIIYLLFFIFFIIAIFNTCTQNNQYNPICERNDYIKATDYQIKDNTLKIECDKTQIFIYPLNKTCSKYDKWNTCIKWK